MYELGPQRWPTITNSYLQVQLSLMASHVFPSNLFLIFHGKQRTFQNGSKEKGTCTWSWSIILFFLNWLLIWSINCGYLSSGWSLVFLNNASSLNIMNEKNKCYENFAPLYVFAWLKLVGIQYNFHIWRV